MTLLDELARRARDRPAIILDDDPTGTQTVRDLPVLLSWSADRIARHLAAGEPAIFLSTNSRALDEADAVELTREAVGTAREAAASAGRPISIVSRSDSTLRGHFPAEVLAVAGAMGAPDARILLAPFFGEGGRVTVDDVHLIDRDGRRTPVGETEFAGDAAFGYRSSNLRDWVAERFAAAGRPAPAIESLSLDLVRRGPAAVAEALGGLPRGGVAIGNAETDADIESLTLGVLRAEEAGLPVVARTAASFVRARAGQPSAAPLAPGELGASGPGLMVVGSHVPTTSAQLAALVSAEPGLEVCELTIARILEGDASTLDQAARDLDAALTGGRSGVVMTERTRRDIDLSGGRRISEALAAVVDAITHQPAWVLAKGGITSHDVARRGLRMAEARIAGPLLPGVPVWVGEAKARWPGMPLVVFPGNVGGPDALVRAYRLLTGRD